MYICVQMYDHTCTVCFLTDISSVLLLTFNFNFLNIEVFYFYFLGKPVYPLSPPIMQLDNTFEVFPFQGHVPTEGPYSFSFHPAPSFLKYLSHCSSHTPIQDNLQGVRFILFTVEWIQSLWDCGIMVGSTARK